MDDIDRLEGEIADLKSEIEALESKIEEWKEYAKSIQASIETILNEANMAWKTNEPS